MKKKLLFLSLGVMSCGSSVFAQQDMNLTHFIFNKMNFNPGATAMDPGICGTLMYRNQWDKVNGAPNSIIFNAEANLDDRMLPVPGRIGIATYHDEIGFARQTNAVLNYSYPLKFEGFGVLGIGVGLGIQNFGMDPTWVPPSTMNDPSLPTGYASTKFDMNFGAYYKADAGYYVGISSTHLTAPAFNALGSVSPNPNNPTQPIDYNSARHYYLMAGHKIRSIGGGKGDLEANLLLKTEFVKVSADVNVRYIYDNWMYGGITYRFSDAAAVMVGADIFKGMNKFPKQGNDRLIFGYSYDFTINQLSNISKGSHELLLKYCHYLPPIPLQISRHPRWL